MELTWDEKTGNDTGAVQAAQIYQKAADIYDEILTELKVIKQQCLILNCKPKFAQIKKLCGIDLHPKTLEMLKHVMLAQALYL